MTPEGGVAALLNPRSVAILGASERSRWSSLAVENLQGFAGPLHLVNRRGGTVHGRPAAESCRALGEPVDLGVVLVPLAAVPDAIADLSAAGARSAVVLTSGFAEAGPEGAALQDGLVAQAGAAGIRLLGPNCLGFINFADDVRVWTTPVETPTRRKGVAIVSQSGATALFLSDLARRGDVGLSHVVSTGHEADLDVAAFVDHLVDADATRAIALFIETVRLPARFIAAARKALDRGVPIAVLEVGASEVTAKAAAAHTGALVGDDRVFDGPDQGRPGDAHARARVRTAGGLLARSAMGPGARRGARRRAGRGVEGRITAPPAGRRGRGATHAGRVARHQTARRAARHTGGRPRCGGAGRSGDRPGGDDGRRRSGRHGRESALGQGRSGRSAGCAVRVEVRGRAAATRTFQPDGCRPERSHVSAG